MKKYILASSSPRRRKLCEEAHIPFSVVIPDDEESILNKSFSYETVERIATNKGKSVLKKINEPCIIISADTVVVYNNIILGKPRDFDDAIRMLKLLSGKTHIVVTSVCVIDSVTLKTAVKSETTEVTFKQTDIDQIKNYVYAFKPYDKAGAYGIQELNDDYIADVNGDYTNVVGLPVKLLKSMLSEFNTQE